ncbi:MAG: replication protein C [Planctomycetaceae bacterium]|nr:replication protein C [Planctomycetaceae bacterium]
MKHNGWRKPALCLQKAEKLAEAGEQLSIPKNRSVTAVKRVAAAIGVKSQDLLLLDTLCAFTQPQDWEEGRRPIIWASNDYLMEQTGFSLTTLKRHGKRLAELGIIAFKDSANGKRWGRRGDDGYIVEAYGFDLAPMAARAEEFELLSEQIQEERSLCQAVKRQITVARRMIRSKIEAAITVSLTSAWRDFHASYHKLIDMIPGRKEASERLLDVLDGFKALQGKVEEAFAEMFSDKSVHEGPSEAVEISSFSRNVDPREPVDGPHILTTKHLNLVNSNINEKRKKNQPSPKLLPPIENDRPEKEINWGTGASRKLKSEVEISTVMAACPSFAEMARNLGGGYIRDWNEFHRAAGKIRPIAGISEDAWNIAQKVLGPWVAAAAIALIFDKHSSGEVSSPGGYLRGMVDKAKAGDLHLDRSFYGRMNEGRAMH